MKKSVFYMITCVLAASTAQAGRVIATVPAGDGPRAVAVNPVTNRVYIANDSSNNVTVIDGATNDTTTVFAGDMPYAAAVNPVTNRVYVANRGSDNVTVIDGEDNSTTTVATGLGPFAVAVNRPRTRSTSPTTAATT